MKVIIVLLALGRYDFADIAQYSEDSLLKEILGLNKIPSQETLRQRLNDLGALNPSQELLDNCVVELLGKVQDFGQESLQCKEAMPIETEVNRRRLRSVMQNFIYIAYKITRHAKNVILKFGCNCQWYKSFEYVYTRC